MLDQGGKLDVEVRGEPVGRPHRLEHLLRRPRAQGVIRDVVVKVPLAPGLNAIITVKFDNRLFRF